MKKIVLFVFLGILMFGAVLVFAYSIEYGTTIHTGWNLVYGFANPEQIQGLAPENIKAIYAFIPTTQEYVRMYPDREDNKITIDDDELLNTAFWVYSDSETGEDFNGVHNGVEYWLEMGVVPFEERSMYKGWNFVGITHDMTIDVNSASSEEESNYVLNAMKGNCNFEEVYTYAKDGGEMKWMDLLNNPNFMDSEPLDNSLAGMGLVIKVSSNCKMGRSSGTSPPVLPGNVGSGSWKDYIFEGDIGNLEYDGTILRTGGACELLDNFEGSECSMSTGVYENEVGQEAGAFVEIYDGLTEEKFVQSLENDYGDDISQGDYLQNDYYFVINIPLPKIYWYSGEKVIVLSLDDDLLEERGDYFEDLLMKYLPKYPSDLNFD
jgi:hypothetical protein